MEKASAMEASCALLEQRHVHDVYEKTAHHFRDTNYKAWPKVKQFLKGLEPGSLVADVGCGTGRYLGINSNVFKLGCDHCCHLVEIARDHDHEVMICDNLRLPYRDNSFDSVISVAVIHHLTTTERRLVAVQELARILRPGGKLMIYVWAMEQKHRKFKSQDVLVPWHMKTKNQQYREKKKLKFEMERSSTNSISEDDEGDSSRNTPKHESFPAQMLPAHVETCSESAPTSESTRSRVINSPKSKAHAQTINAAHNTNIFSTSSEEHIELMNDSGAKVEKHCNENKINRVVASCTGFGKTPPRRRVGIPSRLRQHLRSLFRGNEALQEELEADINPKKLIEKMMRDEGKSFPFPYHILEHSISDPTIEGFAVREFPLSSQMRSASTDCEPCDDCSEANDLTRDSSVMYPRQCETVGGTGEGSATHPSEAINGDRHDDVCLTDGSWVGDTSSSSVINKFDMKAATVIDKSRSEDNHVEIACNQATCDEHYDDVFHAPVSVLEGDMGNKAKSYHGDNGEDISEVRSTLRSHSYHEDAINEHIPRQMTTLNVPKDSVLSSGTGPSDARLNVGNNYTDSTIGSNYNNHRNNVTISHDDTGSDDIRSGVNGDDNSRDVTEGTVSNGDVSDDDTNEISKDQSLRRQCKQVPPLVRHNSDNEEWARRTAEAIEAIQSQVLKGADNSNGQQVGLDLGTLHDKLNGASRSCATSCSSCDLYSESSTDDDNGENGLNNITSATSILAKTVATTNKDRTQGTAVDKTTDCAPDTADNNDTFKRFYHVFCEGELVELIEKNIECLDIISAYYDHANWCVVAEKVQVWKI